MPIYYFKCTSCDHAFDLIQSMKASRPEVCGECGGTLVQDFSGFGVVTKNTRVDLQRQALQKAMKDVDEINRGNQNVLEDVAGTKTGRKVPSGVKYMKDVKKGPIKRAKQ